MRTRPLVAVGALIATLTLPAVAAAKGASSATIVGPGLRQTIVLAGDGEPGSGTPLGRIADWTGFFPGLVGQSPDPMLYSRPRGDLGPAYTITYVLPGPNGDSRIVQDVYPYAKPFPISHMRPGQRFWEGQTTKGGWYVASPGLTPTLVDLGLPAQEPGGGDSGLDTPLIAALAAAAAALLVGALAAMRMRRRPRPMVA